MRKMRGVLSSRTLLGSIEPIGTLPDGTLLLPIMGATGDEGGPDEDEDEGEENEEGEDEGKSEEDESKAKPKRRSTSRETPEQKVRRLNAENKARREELEAAQAKLKEIEDKDKSELEIAVRDREEAVAKTATLEQTVQEQGFELAFLRLSVDKGLSWDDAEYVMHKLRKQGLEYADGEVDGLDEAVTDLVKNKPSLLKQEGEEDERPTSTGANPRGSRRKKKNNQNADALAAKYGMASLIAR